MLPVLKLLDKFGAEGREVMGIAAGDEPMIDHDLFLNPATPSVLDIRLQRWKRCNRATTDYIGFNQQPGTMADCSHGFLLLEKRTRERDCLVTATQLIGGMIKPSN
jgi:hypothetical protein